MRLVDLLRKWHNFKSDNEIEQYILQGSVKVNDVTVRIPWDSDYDKLIVVDGTHVLDVFELENDRLTNTLKFRYTITLLEGSLVQEKKLA
jgi:hypothetical protein